MEIQILYATIVFIIGLLVGSFLNVVILRLNTGESFGGRSKCGACAATLRWYELVPVASFLAQGGRCLSCAARISRQYIVVELLTAAIFLLVYSKETVSAETVFYWLVFSMLVVVAAYDIRHTIIPPQFSHTLIALGILRQIIEPSRASIVVAIGLFLFFAGLWYFSGGRWMGFGDAKLALGIGLLFPAVVSLAGTALAFWVGAIVGILLLFLRKKRFTLKSEMPFAPFLAFGAFIAYFFEFSLPFIVS